MHRVEDLADRPEGFIPKNGIPSIHLIPLEEVIAEAMGYRVGTKGVEAEYERLVERGGSEFRSPCAPPDELASFVPAKILEAIVRTRQGKARSSLAMTAFMGRSHFSLRKGKGRSRKNS